MWYMRVYINGKIEIVETEENIAGVLKTSDCPKGWQVLTRRKVLRHIKGVQRSVVEWIVNQMDDGQTLAPGQIAALARFYGVPFGLVLPEAVWPMQGVFMHLYDCARWKSENGTPGLSVSEIQEYAKKWFEI